MVLAGGEDTIKIQQTIMEFVIMLVTFRSRALFFNFIFLLIFSSIVIHSERLKILRHSHLSLPTNDCGAIFLMSL